MFDYNDPKWISKSEHIKRRDKLLCRDHKRYGKKVSAKVVHHIKDADLYPELAYDDDNLISLCIGCHNKRHPEKGKGKKY